MTTFEFAPNTLLRLLYLHNALVIFKIAVFEMSFALLLSEYQASLWCRPLTRQDGLVLRLALLSTKTTTFRNALLWNFSQGSILFIYS